MKRWLTLVLGVGIAVAALAALFAGRPRPATAPPPHDEIDAASRAQLEAVLRREARR